MDALKELEKLMEENKDVLIRLKEGKENRGHIHCPVNGWDCPYWTKEGHCSLYPKEDPAEECDDFYSIWGTDKDYVCYEEP